MLRKESQIWEHLHQGLKLVRLPVTTLQSRLRQDSPPQGELTRSGKRGRPGPCTGGHEGAQMDDRRAVMIWLLNLQRLSKNLKISKHRRLLLRVERSMIVKAACGQAKSEMNTKKLSQNEKNC